MLKIVVCISGGGTNLQAIIDQIRQKKIRDTEIIGVISNNANAYGIKRAEESGIPTYVISPRSYESRSEFNRGFTTQIKRLSPDLVVLAGFLVTIPSEMVQAFPNRIMNIHPSLIPSFCGVGCYGLKVHEKALERGVKITGATVHFVDEGTDTGPIILQKAVEVKKEDTAETLQRRVMEEAEWEILPKAIDLFGQNRIMVTKERNVIIEAE